MMASNILLQKFETIMNLRKDNKMGHGNIIWRCAFEDEQQMQESIVTRKRIKCYAFPQNYSIGNLWVNESISMILLNPR